ncbi:hypothetical protein DFQ28_009469 [Apophysomyces sp. BC1034]|nr:hypothetical protein DFQ30_009168 [Apophysomyces sp. BC1015]KAG0173054.1 hypothetical protein DFQ29_008115 [Apophysomyces sp. BC1021]KAG0185373.1 hypothetical protein DFQ28_009469 [Apophysomyces sp. BC1034]
MDAPQSSKRANPYVSTDEYPEKRQTVRILLSDETSKPDLTDEPINSKDDGEDAKPSFEREKFPYGNYRNYYDDRRNKGKDYDSRLDLLDASLFEKKQVLDIGCNSGNISVIIAQRYGPSFVKGVDIDKHLIGKAQSVLRIAYSLQNPEKASDNASPIDLSMRFHYFPRSMTNLFGFVPMSTPPSFTSTDFPHNVHFQEGDWMELEDEKKYDTILALSVTKWIQLHRGDEGIKAFFMKIFEALNPGGTLVLEPQNFDTYHRRAKMNEKTQSIFDNIKLLPENYKDFLMNEVGFSEMKELGVSDHDRKGFKRPLFLYIK